jgi:hypothetical protein
VFSSSRKVDALTIAGATHLCPLRHDTSRRAPRTLVIGATGVRE